MSGAAPTAPQLFTTIVPTAYGQMLVNRNDINQTTALFRTGMAPDHQEIVLHEQLQRLFSRFGGAHGVTFVAQHGLERTAHVLLVVHDEHG